jgi:small conductance mechanosensitive channel
MEKIIEFIQTYNPLRHLIVAILIFFVGRWLAHRATGFIERAMERAGIEPTVTRFVSHISYVTMLVFIILIALGQLGVQTTSLLAVLGAAGLAIGLALQGSLANFAAGILIVAGRPFKLGDFISSGGVRGTVQEIQIFTTVVHTPDNLRHIIPNAQLTGDVITNYSANETRRVDLTIGVSYDDDVQQVKQVLTDLVTADPLVLEQPAPFVALSDFGDNSVNFVIRVWVKRPDFRSVRFGLPEQIKQAFDAQGITIPYPQRDVHLRNGAFLPQVHQRVDDDPQQEESTT